MTSHKIEISSTAKINDLLSQPSSNSLFDQLFTYIKKNVAIPTFLSSIDSDLTKKEKVQQLLSAINKGEHEAAIFDDPNCHLYLLYLLKNNTELSFYHGMTVYIYLVTLMQCTEKQALKETDQHYKSKRNVSVASLSEQKSLTQEGGYYLKRLARSLDKFIEVPCYDDLVEYVLTLPPSEQWLLVVAQSSTKSIVFEYHDYYFNSLMRQIDDNEAVPFIQVYRGHTYIPSYSIIQFCLNKISKSPIQLQFSFGKLGASALNALHEQGKHPCLIYSPCVQSNLMDVHGGKFGPLPVIIHDLGHTFWGSLLTPSFRSYLYQTLIPNFTELKEKAFQSGDKGTADFVSSVIFGLGDFDLVSHSNYPEKERHFYYLEGSLRVNYINYCGSHSMGERKYDNLLFLMELRRLENPKWDKDHQDNWEFLISKTSGLIDEDRGFHDSKIKISTALKKAAYNSHNNVPMNKTSVSNRHIDWESWLEFINLNLSSETLWKKSIDERHSELLTLIVDYDLTFLHPYLPMTEEKRLKFISFIKEKIQLESASISEAEFTTINTNYY